MATRKTTKQVKKTQKAQKAPLSTLMELGEQPTPLMLLNSKDEFVLGR
ncbi:hypothetical protein BH09BAC1_BH09BAC1_23730 [soil metagenome]